MTGHPIWHGQARAGKQTRAYRCWLNMKSRCLNPNGPAWRYYGGRGITVCERWLTFANFYVDMGRPRRGLTLERVDNEKGYSPDNCVWATRKRQTANRRRSPKWGP